VTAIGRPFVDEFSEAHVSIETAGCLEASTAEKSTYRTTAQAHSRIDQGN